MEIKTDEYTIRDLKSEDRFFLRKWEDFKDPIFYGYNYSDMTDSELSYWYRSKHYPFRSKYFAVLNSKEEMFAYLGMKEINFFQKSSKLGIVMNPAYVSKGLGKKIMRNFLDHYFNELNMKKMVLEVNEWNKRALSLYKGLGFTENGNFMQCFENQGIDLDSGRYDEYLDSFEERYGKIYNRILKMSLTKEQYEGARDENRI